MRSVSEQMSCVSARSASLVFCLEQLRGAANAGQRILDLVREHRGQPRYRTRGGAMGKLALDHLRHVPLLQHEHDQPRLVRHRAAVHVNEFGALKLRPGDLDAVLVHRRAGVAHLLDQRQQRAAEAEHLVELDALQ